MGKKKKHHKKRSNDVLDIRQEDGRTMTPA